MRESRESKILEIWEDSAWESGGARGGAFGGLAETGGLDREVTGAADVVP